MDKYFVLASNVSENNDANTDSIIFALKENCLYQQRTIKNYQNYLAKDLKDQCIGMNMKQRVRIKILQMNIDIF